MSRRDIPHALAGTLVLFLLFLSPLHAQEPYRLRYGVLGGLAFNMHLADFRALPGVPNCCPRFENGDGIGALGGGLFELPLSSSLLLSFHANYWGHDARLAAREGVALIVNGTSRDGAFEHSVDATVASIGLEPSIRYRVFDEFFVSLGARGGLVTTKEYAQEERIVEPSDVGTFLDESGNDSRSRVRNQSSGELPNATSFLMHGVVGIGYELPLNRRGTLLLAPEISYALALNDLVDGLAWKAHALRAGIALKFSPKEKPTRYDTLVVRDTVVREVEWNAPARVALITREVGVFPNETDDEHIVLLNIREHYARETPKAPPINCTISAVGVNDDGVEKAMATLRVEEFLSTVAHPLLNFVFFDRGAAAIPSRYTILDASSASAFRPESLYGSGTLEVYYSMLNVIGERMKRYPQATISLLGCNMDQEEEKGDRELSWRRARAVRDYLMNVWGVDGSRISTDATDLPAKRSNPLTPDGQGENRRVEITSNMPEILDVLVAGDTTRLSDPPLIRLRPSVESTRGVSQWKITIAQRDRTLKTFSGNGALPATLDWDLANERQSVPRYDDPIVITLEATSPDRQRAECRMELPTEVVTVQEKQQAREGDYTIDRYNLILFTVGESGITPRNQRVIDLVKSRLKPASELTIEGFADRSGNVASNAKLSAARAQKTADALGRPDATVRGIGESRLLYSNETPEGRYYCRTVQITVKTRR